jgi:S1-C subfamily serine protease
LQPLGTACGLGVEGSGWVARPGIVVTNAHVVAGETDTVVQVGGNPPNLAAKPLVFDPHNDIAVLSVAGLGTPSLGLAPAAQAGTAAAILGYPEDGPFDAEPGRIGATQEVLTDDAYGNGPVLREITPLRGRVRPGNSGGPLVDRAGQVLATVFAATTNSAGRPGGGGFAVPDSIVRSELQRAAASSGSGTGACAG